MEKLIIGLHGKKRSGKDTAAKTIISMYPPGVVERVAFGDSLKEVCKDFMELVFKSKGYKFDVDYLNEPNIRESMNLMFPEPHVRNMGGKLSWFDEVRARIAQLIYPAPHITARELWQIVGTEIMRKQINQIWIEIAKEKILRSQARIFVITDVRFPNEMTFVKKMNGVSIKIVRPDSDGNAGTHASESHNLVCDYVVFNETGKLEEFNNAVRSTVRGVLSGKGKDLRFH